MNKSMSRCHLNAFQMLMVGANVYIRHEMAKCVMTSKHENELAFESDIADLVENQAESLFY